MIDMSAWETLKVDVLDLHLDPRNVRLELTEDAPEGDIVQDLFVNEKALSLVESIVKVGLLTHEVPIVLRRGRDLVVVEGNRRVAALKAIQNPRLAPTHQARIYRLIEGFPLRDSLRRIEVKKAPSQNDADQLIAALHTGNQRVAWSPSRQAAFFQAQIDSGRTVEELFNLYPTVDVKKFISRSQILNLFRAVDYADPALKDFVKSRRFPVSTLARLYDNDKFLELVGIAVHPEDGTAKLTSGRKRFARVAERIVSGIRSKELDTRSLNSTKSEAYLDLMDSLRDIMNEDIDGDDPPANSTEKTTSSHSGPGNPQATRGTQSSSPTSSNTAKPANGNSQAGQTASQSASSTTGAKPDAKQRPYLDTSQLTVPASYPLSIRQIMQELSTLKIDKFPNATLDLMRTFLEKTIKAYADALGINIRQTLNAQAAGGSGGSRSSATVSYVQLGECLLWLEKHVQNNGPTSLRQVVVKIRSGKVADYVATADHMNAINHNHQVFANPSDVRESWDTMYAVLKTILA